MAKRRRHPGSIARRGKTHLVRLCVDGKVHRFTVKTRDRRVAESVAVQEYERLLVARERSAHGLPSVVRFSDLLSEFEQVLVEKCVGTRRSYGDSLKPIREFFVDGKAGNPPVDTVRTVHIEEYLGWRRMHRLRGRRKTDGGPLHARTLNKDRAVLHRLFTFAERREYREGNPVRHAERRKADRHEPVILNDIQYEALLRKAAPNSILALYVLLLAETGMRCESEALHLRWEDVSLDNGLISVVSGRDGHRTKSGKGRKVPITPRLAAALREYFAAYRFASQSPYIFHHVDTRRHHTNGGRIRSLRSAFKRAAEQAGLPAGFRQHDLRHRRVTTWLADGKSPELVKRAMGHARYETTAAYFQFLPEHLRSLVEDDRAPNAIMAS